MCFCFSRGTGVDREPIPAQGVVAVLGQGAFMTAHVFATRLIIALVLGACIGLERQLRHRMTGTRTNALVATGAAAFTMVGQLITGDPTNPAGVVAYIVAGIGFLGAGVIFKEGANIQGLNTAATVWCSAAVGTLAGMGYPLYSVVTAAAVLTA